MTNGPRAKIRPHLRLNYGGTDSRWVHRLFGMRTRRFFRPRSLAMLGVIVAMLVGSSLVSAASVKRSTSTTIKPDFSFFAGKTINVLLSSGPGSGSDNFTNDVLPAMAAYLHASYKIDANPNLADAAAEDAVEASPPDGLQLGLVTLGAWLSAVIEGSGAPSYSIRKATWLGATSSGPQLIASCTGAPYNTFQGMVSSHSVVNAIDSFPSVSDLAFRLTLVAFNIPHKYLTAYAGASAQKAGCLRGDGQAVMAQASGLTNAAGTAMIPGITPLLMTGKVPPHLPETFLNSQVELLSAYAKAHPPTTKLGKEALAIELSQFFPATYPAVSFYGPAGMTKSHALALTDAMKAAMKMPSVQLAILNNGFPVHFVSGDIIIKDVDLAIKEQPTLVKILNS